MRKRSQTPASPATPAQTVKAHHPLPLVVTGDQILPISPIMIIPYTLKIPSKSIPPQNMTEASHPNTRVSHQGEVTGRNAIMITSQLTNRPLLPKVNLRKKLLEFQKVQNVRGWPAVVMGLLNWYNNLGLKLPSWRMTKKNKREQKQTNKKQTNKQQRQV